MDTGHNSLICKIVHELKKRTSSILPVLRINIPDFDFDNFTIKTENRVSTGFDLNGKQSYIIPDITLVDSNNAEVFIEVEITHKVDKKKEYLIKNLSKTLVTITSNPLYDYSGNQLLEKFNQAMENINCQPSKSEFSHYFEKFDIYVKNSGDISQIYLFGRNLYRCIPKEITKNLKKTIDLYQVSEPVFNEETGIINFIESIKLAEYIKTFNNESSQETCISKNVCKTTETEQMMIT